MYSDLFDQLGAGGGPGGGRNRGGSDSVAAENATPPLVSFKAGRIKLVPKHVTDGEEKDDDDDDDNALTTYVCQADEMRGEVRMVWKDNALQWQWYDRRNKRVADTDKIEVGTNGTFERVDLGYSKKHKDDRIYCWTKNTTNKKSKTESAADSTAAATDKSKLYSLFWMQDANAENDDEMVAQVNQYLADPASAAPEGTADVTATTSGGGDAGAGGTGGTAPEESASGGSAGAGSAQVDALSSILQNLGMPQTGASGDGSSGTGPDGAAGGATTAASAAAGTLTLADLQGAMAGMQTQSTAATPVGLAEVVTPEAISNLLADEAVRNRLLQLLPQDQQTAENLEENLRSPQVQQTLRSLTSALVSDDHGNMDGFYSVLANFSLDPSDGQEAIAANNPVQAFLDCVLASVEKEQKEENKEEESKNE